MNSATTAVLVKRFRFEWKSDLDRDPEVFLSSSNREFSGEVGNQFSKSFIESAGSDSARMTIQFHLRAEQFQGSFKFLPPRDWNFAEKKPK